MADEDEEARAQDDDEPVVDPTDLACTCAACNGLIENSVVDDEDRYAAGPLVVCASCQEPLHLRDECDKVWAPDETHTFCSRARACVIEFNTTAHEKLPVRQRPEAEQQQEQPISLTRARRASAAAPTTTQQVPTAAADDGAQQAAAKKQRTSSGGSPSLLKTWLQQSKAASSPSPAIVRGRGGAARGSADGGRGAGRGARGRARGVASGVARGGTRGGASNAQATAPVAPAPKPAETPAEADKQSNPLWHLLGFDDSDDGEAPATAAEETPTSAGTSAGTGSAAAGKMVAVRKRSAEEQKQYNHSAYIKRMNKLQEKLPAVYGGEHDGQKKRHGHKIGGWLELDSLRGYHCLGVLTVL